MPTAPAFEAPPTPTGCLAASPVIAARLLLGFLAWGLFAQIASGQIGGTGWRPLTVNFKIQSPTNAPQSARYFFTNNIFHCLVYSNDGAFSVGNTTRPRTEQRFNPDYTNGEIQFQATLMAPASENSYCVFQIHTGDAQSPTNGSTTFMAFWFTNFNGSVRDYSGTTLATNLGGQWFQLNVDHNLVTQTIRVWINKNLVWTQPDNRAGDFYFKDGVYEQGHGPTYQMDTYITNNIREWISSGTNPPAPPEGLAAIPAVTQVALTWNSSVAATNYNVKRATAGAGPYTPIARLAGTNYTDTSAISGATNFYTVSALGQFGESSNSEPIAVIFPPAPPVFDHMSIQGNKLLLDGTGGAAGAVFYALTSTDLTLPPGLWKRVATNSFGSQGSFSVSNGVAPAATQQFYLLELK